MATVRKRTWTHNGKRKSAFQTCYTMPDGTRATKSFARERDAKDYKLKVETEIEAGVHVPLSTAITFATLADLYIADCERRRRLGDKMTGLSLRLNRSTMKLYVRPRLAQIKLPEITRATVQSMVDDMAERYSRHTIRAAIGVLRSTLRFAMEKGAVRRNVVRDEPPRIPLPKSAQIEIPSISDLQRLILAIDQPHENSRNRSRNPIYRKTMIYLALFAGMRIGEVCGLQWENVDLANGVVHIKHSFSAEDGLKEPKSRAGFRTVPLAPQLLDVLVALHARRGCPKTGHVLSAVTGDEPILPSSAVQTYWRSIAKKANVRRADGGLMSFHALRHAAGSLWIRAGLPLLRVKYLLGHANIQITMDTYGHLFPEDDAGARVAIAAAATLTSHVPPTIDGTLLPTATQHVATRKPQTLEITA